ncbi:uncharacterized protein F4807DRAFT_406927 [Annulohypoxylon truncatum]|uniref:uncharacterized protein n=1 Tax=Annulohypoxylon truncatum TaxID=327061 RepID=UPI00200890D6|nr:uncharacterized protein F4807DRAFT_406927 [Annulohypoxylon truncatum]KAI1214155.1 hypothetical protein F4807DRAFT_406927 [Annulohypoxylon truncatum]
MSSKVYEVVVVGGGPVGLAATYEVAKTGAKVIVLEQNNFFNHAGSSNDLARMFRTMYTEDVMADLAEKAMGFWDNLEKDSGTILRWMTGLLNFGDKEYGNNTPEGTLLGPIDNLKKHGMPYKEWTAKEIEARYPFKNLPAEWTGLYAYDNGIINVQRLLRTLLSLAKAYGAEARQNTQVKRICPPERGNSTWKVHTNSAETNYTVIEAKKIIIASGSYINDILKPSFDISLDLDIWEMAVSYFNCKAGPGGTIFPSMWYQFAPPKGDRSQLFYGFPTLPWGPPNVTRIAIDAATRRIKDPSNRLTNVVNPDDISDVQQFIKEHVVGVDSTVPASTTSCLQTNVFDNMFVLDFIPQKHLKDGPPKSVVVFTAGWAMKFVPLLGKALADMSLKGESDHTRPEFKIDRKNQVTGRSIIVSNDKPDEQPKSSFDTLEKQASGSSIKGLHNTGLSL